MSIGLSILLSNFLNPWLDTHRTGRAIFTGFFVLILGAIILRFFLNHKKPSDKKRSQIIDYLIATFLGSLFLFFGVQFYNAVSPKPIIAPSWLSFIWFHLGIPSILLGIALLFSLFPIGIYQRYRRRQPIRLDCLSLFGSFIAVTFLLLAILMLLSK